MARTDIVVVVLRQWQVFGSFTSTSVLERCGLDKAMLELVRAHVCVLYTVTKKGRPWASQVERP